MKRKYVPIAEAIKWGKEQCAPKFNKDNNVGICAVVDVENMGFCKNGITRWYHFNMDGIPCYTLKF